MASRRCRLLGVSIVLELRVCPQLSTDGTREEVTFLESVSLQLSTAYLQLSPGVRLSTPTYPRFSHKMHIKDFVIVPLLAAVQVHG